ncbi:MAG: hypothetical protein AAGC56_08935 [Pseudomonadota bacterium]
MKNAAEPLTLNEIGIGAGHAVWGFRASVVSRTDCPTLIKGFENILFAYGRPAIHALAMMAQTLGSQGRRKLGVACPGCGYVTADELSIVALLAALQRDDDALANAHLSWLMGGRGEAEAKTAASRIAALFAAGSIAIDAPPIEISTPTKPLPEWTLHSAGHA